MNRLRLNAFGYPNSIEVIWWFPISFLVFFLVEIQVGCSDPKPDITIAIEEQNEEPESVGRRTESGRMTQIDLALALWYGEQLAASAQIEYILGIEFGPINRERDPEDILREQRMDIEKLEVRHISRNEETADALRQWYWCQIEALNHIKKVLGEQEMKTNREYEPDDLNSILDLQKGALDLLKREIVTNGYRYWPHEK